MRCYCHSSLKWSDDPLCWTQTWGCLSPCPPFSLLPSPSYVILLLLSAFIHSFPVLPSLVALNSSSFLGGNGSDPPAAHNTQNPQAGLCQGLLSCSSPWCHPDCLLLRQGVKWDSRSCLWLHPRWDIGTEQGNGSQAEQWQDFSALSSLLFLGFPRLPWCCLGRLAKSLQHHFVSQKDPFNVFQNASLPFQPNTSYSVWLLS